eukprot:gi/632936577/ref/XP_007895406.1/ PREDICTED: rhotekin-2 isoform X2 [Callorhinchus milii]
MDGRGTSSEASSDSHICGPRDRTLHLRTQPDARTLGSYDCNIQDKMDFEIRMREGICKLLAACTQRDQVVQAAKNLLTCNARILGYMAELQKRKEEQILHNMARRSPDAGRKEHSACYGKIAISDIRIPLMWKDSDHFNNRGKTQRFAVFCLLKIGANVFDTELVIVDKSLTDICFENLIIFNNTKPDFELKLEVYSCCMEDEPSLANTPRRLARKLSTSLSRSTGKKITLGMESGDLNSILLTNPVAIGAKYNLLAETLLRIDNAESSFRTHSLTIIGNEESSFWVPLYGNLCCRLVAQPACMTDDVMTGFLNLQQIVGGLLNWTRLYCILRGGYLIAHYTPEEIEAKVDPTLIIPVNKETRVRDIDKDSKKTMYSFSIVNPYAGKTMSWVFATDCKEDLCNWMEAFWQHFYDMSQWKHCCKELMKIEIMSPRKPPLFLTKQATSVYHDMTIESPLKDKSLMDIIHNKIEETDGEFLLGHQQVSEPPLWAALFDGTHNIIVQRNVQVPDQNKDNATTSSTKGKKRPAPPPPVDKQPYKPETACINQSQKENWKTSVSTQKMSILVPKLSSTMQQVHRSTAISHRHFPTSQACLNEGSNQAAAKPPLFNRPVPAPRQRGPIKNKLDPRTWVQSQV